MVSVEKVGRLISLIGASALPLVLWSQTKPRSVISAFRHREHDHFHFNTRDHLSVTVKPMKIFSSLIHSQKQDQLIVKWDKIKELLIVLLRYSPTETLTLCAALCIETSKKLLIR